MGCMAAERTAAAERRTQGCTAGCCCHCGAVNRQVRLMQEREIQLATIMYSEGNRLQRTHQPGETSAANYAPHRNAPSRHCTTC